MRQKRQPGSGRFSRSALSLSVSCRLSPEDQRPSSRRTFQPLRKLDHWSRPLTSLFSAGQRETSTRTVGSLPLAPPLQSSQFSSAGSGGGRSAHARPTTQRIAPANRNVIGRRARAVRVLMVSTHSLHDGGEHHRSSAPAFLLNESL